MNKLLMLPLSIYTRFFVSSSTRVLMIRMHANRRACRFTRTVEMISVHAYTNGSTTLPRSNHSAMDNACARPKQSAGLDTHQ